MSVNKLLNLFLFFIFFSAPAIAEYSDQWMHQCIDLAINTRFGEAEKLIKNRIANGDSGIVEFFMLSSVLNSKMTHFENQLDHTDFINAINKAISKADYNLANPEHNGGMSRARLLFYRGSAYGYLGLYQGQTNSWFDALDNGMQSVSDLKEAVALDSTIYEAHLGIGVYQYWRSTKLKYLYWMPFIEDQRMEGIRNIKKAVQYDNPSRYMAMHQLIYILLNFGLKDEAVPYAEEVIKVYPNSTFMWWAYAHTWYMRHEYPKAVDAYKHLLSLLHSLPGQNSMHILACHAKLAEIYFKLGQPLASRDEAELAIRLAQGQTLSKEGRKSVEKAIRILDDLKD